MACVPCFPPKLPNPENTECVCPPKYYSLPPGKQLQLPDMWAGEGGKPELRGWDWMHASEFPQGSAEKARPSLIPSLCTHCTRSGIEWRR